MGFYLKKIISQFLMPETFSLIIAFIGICFLWFSKRQKTGKILVSLSFILLILFSYSFFINIFLNPLAVNQQPKIPQNIKYIVVLGGGIKDKNISTINRLNSSSLSRLIKGIKLLKNNKGEKLVFVGGSFFHKTAESKIMKDITTSLGVKKSKIIIEPKSIDTSSHTVRIKEIVGNNKFLLVTSSYHIYRACMIFKHAGLNPIPAPVGYFLSTNQSKPSYYFPTPHNLNKFSLAVHEYLGILWFKIKNLFSF